jgi:hypothetical protein
LPHAALLSICARRGQAFRGRKGRWLEIVNEHGDFASQEQNRQD